jgi:predicted XRE-type DNA-binding protein
VNPRHLFVGTHFENMVDATLKHRMRKRLLPEIVERIHEFSAFLNQRELGEHFGIAQTTVSKILRRATWRHVNHPTSQVA